MKKIINIAVIGGGYNSTISGTNNQQYSCSKTLNSGFFSKDKNKNIKNSSLYFFTKDSTT